VGYAHPYKKAGRHQYRPVLPASLSSVQSPKRFSSMRRLGGDEAVSPAKEVQMSLKGLGEWLIGVCPYIEAPAIAARPSIIHPQYENWW
jgi:hypothetical protein